MAARFALSATTLLLASGKVNAGGKINFYTSGGTTDLATFATSALSAANVNPLILDSSGVVPEAWANDTDVYSIQILDANDNVIIPTFDDVSFIAAFSLSSADVASALASNSAPLILNGSQMSGTAFGSFADDLTFTASGSLNTSTGTATIPNITGALAVSGTLNTDDTTESTSTITGSIQADGGAGIVGNAHIGGDMVVGGSGAIGSAIISTTDFNILGSGTNNVLVASSSANVAMMFTGTADQSYTTVPSSTDTALGLRKDATTSRSINASGTLNASGADYAEYVKLKDPTVKIAKGDIIGFDVDGLIVNKFSESLSFGVKSTDPNLVGGDTWGSEEEIGLKPLTPEKPKLMSAPKPPVKPASPKDQNPVRLVQFQDEMARYNPLLVQYNTDKAQWDADKVIYDESMINHTNVVMPAFDVELQEFKARLEVARQSVDRIAFCGVVPVNASGAPGEYIIPIGGPNDTITAKAVASPELADYINRVGQVSHVKEGKVYILVNMG